MNRGNMTAKQPGLIIKIHLQIVLQDQRKPWGIEQLGMFGSNTPIVSSIPFGAVGTLVNGHTMCKILVFGAFRRRLEVRGEKSRGG